ncbi:hypothetical protein QWY99_01315 [Flavobacterium branchiarum]|uniref:Uncharacterized protein n=1 Tax=Flavobacterium branchiarum TaxID=1114870 RepID=A0ABV5FQU6_9FLAO|nr:hypothetical protein [Flavobacterium branchiarum]MDN3671705.1 hypothetical protein [Flavobacterium branchiarum]
MATLAQIYDWFMTGKKPTQAQFWASWGSFWNKEEAIPQSAISNLASALNAKAEKDQFDGHKTDVNAHADLFEEKLDVSVFEDYKNDPNAHAALFAKAKVFAIGEMLVFKTEGNEDDATREIGDFCMGFVENQFISAPYLGGDIMLLSSYDI